MTRPTTHPTHTEAVADAAASGFKGANVNRIEEIEAQLKAAKSHASPVLMMPTNDVEYLLSALEHVREIVRESDEKCLPTIATYILVDALGDDT